MPVDALLDYILERDEDIDRGWMIVERDSINHAKVTRALEYIRANLHNNILTLDMRESHLMAEAIDEGSGVKIRRHIIIQLESFGFITRNVSTPAWQIRITESGNNYLNALNKRRYFQEQVIQNLIFCNEHWAPSRRAVAYSDFNINIYQAVSRIMPEVGNKIYLEELAYFASKIKREGDINRAIELIKEYRALEITERIGIKTILEETLNIDVPDKFGNWRKLNKRTWEFFSMGTEFYLDYTPDSPIETFPLRRWIDEPPKQTALLVQQVTELEQNYPYDNIPEVPRDETGFNSGIEGENIIKNILEHLGFDIKIYTGSNKGFDILAMKGNSKFFVEVKSSIRQCNPTLTDKEYSMAERYGEVYILAIVENVFEKPDIFFIINPTEKLRGNISPRHSTTHTIQRTDWLIVANRELNELPP